MKKTTAFAPANISCIFKIHKGATPQTTGSTGVGFTINKGVSATVEHAEKTEIFFNAHSITIAPVASIMQKLIKVPVRVQLLSEFPLGGGFGISGATTLATAYAINDLVNLGMDTLELAKLCHVAEVESGTGLGDIINQYFGGFLLKVRPSFQFEAVNLQIADQKVYCKYIAPLETKAIIQNPTLLEKINTAATTAMEKIENMLAKDNISFGRVISVSKEFAVESTLLQNEEVIQTIDRIEKQGGHASMIMLGNGVFSDIPFEGAKEYIISD